MGIKQILTSLKQTARKYRLSFRWKIIAPFFLLGLWLVLSGALIITNIVFENANERFNNQLIEGSKIAAEWMVKEEANQLEALRFIAYTSGVPEAVAAGDAEQLRSLTFTIALNQQLEAVEFLGLDGKLLFSMRHQPGGLPENYRFVRNGEAGFAALGFVQNALKAKMDQRGDKYAGLAVQDRETFFYIAGPLYDAHNQVVGAVLVGTTPKTLLAHLREQTFARITLYQPDGMAVASAFTEKNLLTPAQAGQILDRSANASVTRTVRSLETDFVEIINPWQARGETMGALGVAYARPAFINPSIPTRIGMFIFVLAVFILIVLIGYLLANQLTRPLVDLTRASQEVSRGNLQVRVPAPAMNDELTDLTYTFNGMLVSLDQAHTQILEAYDTTLAGWALAMEMHEQQTAAHQQRVSEMTVRLAQEMGLSGENLVNIRRGSLLHDIGKIGISDEILNKPGPLTAEEISIMRQHPDKAWQVLSQIEYLRPALLIPHYHHEKWDGSGYPSGLRGEEIPLPVRIFSIIDVWDAIVTDRVYRKAMTFEQAMAVIQEGRGTFFDPQVVDTFLKILPELYTMSILPEETGLPVRVESDRISCEAVRP